MNQASVDQFLMSLKEEEILILDSTNVKTPAVLKSKFYQLPITELAHKAGGGVVANIVALGALVGLTGIVSEKSLREVLLRRVPKGTEELNERALNLGLTAAKEILVK
jgi:2-oxoglutarate ferredoxin oxidoreductase subunit gamma